MEKEIEHIVIVGGGSAGWLTAGLLAAEHSQRLQISVIESSQVASIGVGEGTWPSMRNTLQRIGLNESEFISSCDASFKQGSKFINWRNNTENDYFYHPFMTPDGYGHIDLHAAWHPHQENIKFAQYINHQSAICQQGLAPKQLSTPPYAAVTNYGYHLDATKFANLLRHHCTHKLDVAHITAHVSRICNDDLGYIHSIETNEGKTITGDLFIDCSGVHSLIIGQHYGIKMQSQRHVLFNDRALAVQVPYNDPGDAIESTTLSTAQPAGWIWDIGLPSRRGTGYVYSSQYCTEEQAKETLSHYLRQSLGQNKTESLSYRTIKFDPGYREKFWHKNCLAIGMSSGFIEPLEASALAMVELSITQLSEQLPRNRQHMSIIAKRFNERFEYRWQRVIEFLKLHYVLSERKDTPYWLDNRETSSIPNRLQELLLLWQEQPPSRYDLIQQEEIFPSASYQYILYGMNFNTRTSSKTSKEQAVIHNLVSRNTDKINQCLDGLPNNRTLIELIIKASYEQ